MPLKRFTLNDFKRRFPDDDSCLHFIWNNRYGKMEKCPKCNNEASFQKTNKRRSYQCASCGFQIYPTAGTIFHRMRIPLNYIFFACYLQCTTRNGVSAKEFERIFQISYPTALYMAHKIKILMGSRQQGIMTGIIEADEIHIGQSKRTMHHSVRKGTDRKLKVENKTIVLGMLERKGGIVTEVVPNTEGETLKGAILERVAPDSILFTDSLSSYVGINQFNIKHYSVNHQQGEYVRGLVHTQSIESFWNQVRRTLSTHVHVSPKHLQKYLDEVSFRHLYKEKQDEMFDIIWKNLSNSSPPKPRNPAQK